QSIFRSGWIALGWAAGKGRSLVNWASQPDQSGIKADDAQAGLSRFTNTQSLKFWKGNPYLKLNAITDADQGEPDAGNVADNMSGSGKAIVNPHEDDDSVYEPTPEEDQHAENLANKPSTRFRVDLNVSA
ncbi:hypothetical protein, partial [Rhizobium sp. PDO1-076]|uniref:hypothetical protein n=1 Tax=Rhizobium sp. PDO1-076 TaxID=1125979 RepID=UPI000562FE5C